MWNQQMTDKIEQTVSMVMVGQQRLYVRSFPCICLGRALDTSAILKCSFKFYDIIYWNDSVKSHEMPTGTCHGQVSVDLEQEATCKGSGHI